MCVFEKLSMRLPVCFHQKKLFGPGKLLDCIFPAKGTGLVWQTLLINQRNRQMAAGIFGANARLMLPETFFHICGNAGI